MSFALPPGRGQFSILSPGQHAQISQAGFLDFAPQLHPDLRAGLLAPEVQMLAEWTRHDIDLKNPFDSSNAVDTPTGDMLWKKDRMLVSSPTTPRLAQYRSVGQEN